MQHNMIELEKTLTVDVVNYLYRVYRGYTWLIELFRFGVLNIPLLANAIPSGATISLAQVVPPYPCRQKAYS